VAVEGEPPAVPASAPGRLPPLAAAAPAAKAAPQPGAIDRSAGTAGGAASLAFSDSESARLGASSLSSLLPLSA